MEKITIYVRVGNRRHVFKVPEGITLDTLISRYKDELGLTKISLKEIRAAISAPLGTPLDEIRIIDGSEIIIFDHGLSDDIEYNGIE